MTTEDRTLTVAEAYEAAYRVIWHYTEREPLSESLQLMLVAMEPADDYAQTADPASWEDWLQSVSEVGQSPVPRFHRALVMPGTTDRLALVPSGDGHYLTMVAQRVDGSEVWSASPPGGDKDAWVSIRIEGNAVLANSFSGWLVRFDAASGRELQRHFTKW